MQVYVGWAVLGILLYPVGIPVAIATALLYNRHRLNAPSIRMMFGVIYEGTALSLPSHPDVSPCVTGYSPNRFWFELVDLLHKLLLTSLIAFLPATSQLPLAIVCHLT